MDMLKQGYKQMGSDYSIGVVGQGLLDTRCNRGRDGFLLHREGSEASGTHSAPTTASEQGSVEICEFGCVCVCVCERATERGREGVHFNVCIYKTCTICALPWTLHGFFIHVAIAWIPMHTPLVHMTARGTN